jgi:hypothetical protein
MIGNPFLPIAFTPLFLYDILLFIIVLVANSKIFASRLSRTAEITLRFNNKVVHLISADTQF